MDTHSNMYIWDLDSLAILHHLASHDSPFGILNFSYDGRSIISVMDSSMRILSPAVLARKHTQEDARSSDAVIRLAAKEGDYMNRKGSKVTALCEQPTSGVVFAGTYNGQVTAFAAKGSGETRVLYSHQHEHFITDLAVAKQNMIASCDVTDMVQV